MALNINILCPLSFFLSFSLSPFSPLSLFLRSLPISLFLCPHACLGSKNGQVISTSGNQDSSAITMAETSSLGFGTQDPLTYTNPTHQTLGGLGVTGYSAFPSAAGDGSWTPTFDPTMMGNFGFTGPNVLTAAPNQFFFPSTDVWSQDPLMMNSAMNSSWLLSPVPLDQPQVVPGAGLSVDGTVANTLEPMSNIEQTFNSMSLNGSMQTLLPALGTPQLITGTPTQGLPTDATVNPPLANPPQDSKPKSWAAIASQPAKPRPPPPKPAPPPPKEDPPTKKPQGSARLNQHGQGRGPQSGANAVPTGGSGGSHHSSVNGSNLKKSGPKGEGSPKKLDVVSKLKSENSYNPSELTVNLNNARFFVIKSYAEDDVHRSIKYNVWCSTEHGNRRLDSAFKEQRAKGGSVYLFFSVNGSGHFCGVAQMLSEVDLGNDTGIWTQDKWKGKFDIKWIYVKDVPNSQLRHIRLENNENKPVTNSRDTQEVLPDKGKLVMKVIHSYNHTTSIFDDFEHYEKRQEEESCLSEGGESTQTSVSKKV